MTDSDEDDPDEDEDGDYTEPQVPDTLDYGTRLLRYRSGRTMLTGSDVAAVQTRLAQLGFNPGTADGVYGPKTVAAVRRLQTLAGIEVDGIVGNDTRKALRDACLRLRPRRNASLPPFRIKMQPRRNPSRLADEVSLDIEEYCARVASEMYSPQPEALRQPSAPAPTLIPQKQRLSDTTNHQSFHVG